MTSQIKKRRRDSGLATRDYAVIPFPSIWTHSRPSWTNTPSPPSIHFLSLSMHHHHPSPPSAIPWLEASLTASPTNLSIWTLSPSLNTTLQGRPYHSWGPRQIKYRRPSPNLCWRPKKKKRSSPPQIVEFENSIILTTEERIAVSVNYSCSFTNNCIRVTALWECLNLQSGGSLLHTLCYRGCCFCSSTSTELS